MGVKRAGGSTGAALRFLLLAHGMSFAALAVFLSLRHAALPAGAPMWWGLVAGVAGGLSLTAFYMALARGEMGVSAALSGLLAAGIPALVSMVLEGRPGVLRVAGFLVAFAAIWVIAAGPSPENVGERDRSTLWLAVAGGIGFGVYFVALRMANSLGVVMPMALARAGSLSACGVVLAVTAVVEGSGSRAQGPGKSGIGTLHSMGHTVLWWALGAAVMDTAGNMLFVAATRAGRLDVAAVLASLYPASTILLAAWQLHEKPTRRQMAGMVMALAAVVMITV